MDITSVPALLILVFVGLCSEDVDWKGRCLIEVDYGRIGVKISSILVIVATGAFTDVCYASCGGRCSNNNRTEGDKDSFKPNMHDGSDLYRDPQFEEAPAAISCEIFQ